MSDCFVLAKHGDADATRAVVADLRPRLTRMAAHYARRTGEDADDLLQEAWAGMLEALPVMDTAIGTPRQYLLSRARWRLLDAVRRARVRRCLPMDAANETCAPDPGLDSVIGDAHVNEFLSELQQTQRTVLACLMGGLTWRETGARMGCTSANVAYHVRRIRSRYESWMAEASTSGADA